MVAMRDSSESMITNKRVHPGLPWVGAARAPSPDDRCGLPGLRSLEAACASASMPALVSHAGSRGTGTPSSIISPTKLSQGPILGLGFHPAMEVSGSI
jgi:hypothetical protein